LGIHAELIKILPFILTLHPDKQNSIEEIMKKPRVLYIKLGPVMMEYRHLDYIFSYISKICTGDILLYSSKSRYDEYKQNPKLGDFHFHVEKYEYNNLRRKVITPLKTIFIALKLFYLRKHKYDYVLSGNPLNTGLQATIIKFLTGCGTIIEVNGNFQAAFKYGSKADGKTSFATKVKQSLSRKIMKFTLKRAAAIKLLYPNQIDFLHLSKRVMNRCSVFHEFTSIAYFLNLKTQDDKYILFLGYPWYLKGVDLLIKAFNKIHEEIPHHTLKIVGYIPEGKEYLMNLANNDKVIIQEPVYYDGVKELMRKCSAIVLPSRTEAMGRVLLEAMACRKPIVASNVDGIPMVVKNEFNGLLFEKENHEQLAQCMKKILLDKNYAGTLTKNGFSYVQEKLSEDKYIEHYANVFQSLN